MDSAQLNRFNFLSAKVANTDASVHELNEFKELLNSLNNFVDVSLPQLFINTKEYNNTSKS